MCSVEGTIKKCEQLHVYFECNRTRAFRILSRFEEYYKKKAHLWDAPAEQDCRPKQESAPATFWSRGPVMETDHQDYLLQIFSWRLANEISGFSDSALGSKFVETSRRLFVSHD